jgi:hypothetical protein
MPMAGDQAATLIRAGSIPDVLLERSEKLEASSEKAM